MGTGAIILRRMVGNDANGEGKGVQLGVQLVSSVVVRVCGFGGKERANKPDGERLCEIHDSSTFPQMTETDANDDMASPAGGQGHPRTMD